jgi:hypothetical protein
VARLTPQQAVWRGRFETVIGFAAPVLDLVLAAGERVSRALAPEDYDYYPIRAPEESPELGSPPSGGDSSATSE